MKLTKVEMYGFKSFAQRTEFLIGDGITGIVGPNGCGKSNLVDAIQWALGEQRPTRLRSSGMTDVVYKGDAATVDRAEVSLTFDNASGRIPHPLPEVKVTRRLHLDGEGEYLINDKAAKLREVKDLFLDTGLGVGGYSFMAQGQIDAILRASPTERRVLIEEAAGTSRYRVRRKDAVRRLDRTEQDIARASDLLAELERQVRSLKVQAGRARTWVEKKDRLRAVLAVLFARKRRELQALLAELFAKKEESRMREEGARAELATSEEALSQREEEQAALAAAISDLRTGHAERKARAEHLGSRQAELAQRAHEVAREQEEGTARRVEVAEQIAELAKVEQDADARVAEVATQDRARRDDRTAAQRKVQELARQAQALAQALEELEKGELDLVEAEQRARSELGDVDSHLKALQQSRHKLEERSSERSRAIADAAEQSRALRAKAGECTKERVDLERDLSSSDDGLARLYGERQSLSDRLRHRDARIEADRSRLAVLEDAIARHEGVSEQVRRLLDRAAAGDRELDGIEGIVADLVTAPADVARALEAALGPVAEALVVSDRAAANRILRVLRQEGLERIRILSRAEVPTDAGETKATEESGTTGETATTGEAAPAPTPAPAPLWNELLRAASFEGKDGELLRALLGRFDLLPGDVAMELCSPVAGRALVSGDGEVMLSSFESVSRGRGEFLGLITRRNERERLQRLVKTGEQECAGHRAHLDAMQEEIALRERDRESKAKRRGEAAVRENEAEKELQGADNRLALLRDELLLDAREMIDLDRRRTQLEAERKVVAERRAGLEGKRLEVRARRSKAAEQLQAGTGERQVAEELALTLDVEVATLAERLKAAHEARDSARARLRERQEELKRADRRLVELGEEDAGLAETRADVNSERARLVTEVEGLAQELSAGLGQLERHKAESSGLRHRAHELRGMVEGASRDVQGCELKEQEQRLHLEMLEGKVHEDLSIEPDDLCLQVAEVEAGRAPCLLLPAPPPLAPMEGVAPTGPTESAEAPAIPAEPPTPAAPAAPVSLELEPALFAAPLDRMLDETEKLRATLVRLGPVNVIAIDELQAVEGRATFLQRQRQDLNESKHKLKEMIEEIDRECETRFGKTFADVRDHFRNLFRRLFGGGRADLLLVEGEDPAELGVDIVAAPPGKDPRSLALLSGGERALTAVALLFGLFSTRPSPFCVLDEVDAPLDDVNKERFTHMVREFLAGTQFVIVTHAKVTMAAADVLYGVTMEGNGISRPIAIRFEKEKAHEHVA